MRRAMREIIRLSTEWDAVVAALGPHAHPGLSPSESVAEVVAALEQAQGEAEEAKLMASIEHSGCEKALAQMDDAVSVMQAQKARAERAEAALRKMAEHLREGVRETGGSYDEPPQPADAWSDRAATLLNFYGDILRDTAPSDYERFKASSPENAALLDAEERVLAAEEKSLKAEAALTQIAAWSWDSGSTPAPEVVSRIYCEARAALRDTAPAEEQP